MNIEQERKLARLALEVATANCMDATTAKLDAVATFNSIDFEFKKAKEKYETACQLFPDGINWCNGKIHQFTADELEALATINRWEAV